MPAETSTVSASDFGLHSFRCSIISGLLAVGIWLLAKWLDSPWLIWASIAWRLGEWSARGHEPWWLRKTCHGIISCASKTDSVSGMNEQPPPFIHFASNHTWVTGFVVLEHLVKSCSSRTHHKKTSPKKLRAILYCLVSSGRIPARWARHGVALALVWLLLWSSSVAVVESTYFFHKPF